MRKSPDMTLLIFDCDGVLVDSELLANAALAKLMSDLGHPMTTERRSRFSLGSGLTMFWRWPRHCFRFRYRLTWAPLRGNSSWNDFDVNLSRSKAFARFLAHYRIRAASRRHPREKGSNCRSK